jgi:hypothetical protein
VLGRCGRILIFGKSRNIGKVHAKLVSRDHVIRVVVPVQIVAPLSRATRLAVTEDKDERRFRGTRTQRSQLKRPQRILEATYRRRDNCQLKLRELDTQADTRK